jgi:formamidase
MTTAAITIDPSKPLRDEPATGHNRWHPGLTPVITVDPGDEVVLETRDAFDGQVRPTSTPEDVASLDVSVVHPLTGPVFVNGAEPGDLLEVDILAVDTAAYGFTVQSPGFGFLREDFDEPFIVHWDIDSGFATSAQLPGVAVPAAPFMGTIGVAPSAELFDRALRREQRLYDAGGFVDLPEPRGAVPATGPASLGLRTIPPRENAGNIDIKQLTAGTMLRIPVGVEGALFSAGDAHFAQGDGECCGQAIEVRGTLRARLTLRKAAAAGSTGVHFERRVPTADSGPYYATTGLCVEADDTNRSEDLTLAARNALRAMIEHLKVEYGFSATQAYAICSVAVDLKISQTVDVPNLCVSAFLPLRIFT